jgi:SAM-dependent methyltransferase
MTDWQERITRDTPPAIRIEHDVRYRLATPLIASSVSWCDLGCGNGLAAAAALGGAFGGRAVLVDLDESAAANAAREIHAGDTVTLAADLTREPDLERVRAAVLDGPEGSRTITCFEVVEHLATFVPLLEGLMALSTEHGVDVVLSVPNDAFWTIENPHHQAMWGEGAFEELKRLLPAGAVLLRQIALSGSIVVPLDADGGGRADLNGRIAVDAGAAVPTHMLVAFGPRATALMPTAGVSPVDLDGQRRWEREREAAVAVVDELLQVAEENRRQARWFTEWRAYINHLERRLGLPISGAAEDESPPALPAAGNGAAAGEAPAPAEPEPAA